MEKVEEHIADVIAKGGKVVMGGKRHDLGGTFFEPTDGHRRHQEMKVAKEETFGPLAPLFRSRTRRGDRDGQRHDLRPGLLFLRPRHRPHRRVAEALEYGIVGVNTGIISTEVAPFGGVKQSGLGREGSHHGIEDYLEMKYICMSV